MNETTVAEAEGALVLADYFTEEALADDSHIEYADPDDDPLADLAPALHYINGDGSEGQFYDGKEKIGDTLIAIILDCTRSRTLWTPGEDDPLFDELGKFPQGRPLCQNNDVGHDTRAFQSRELTDQQLQTLRDLGAGDCATCELTKKGCRGGRKLLIFNPRWDEPVGLEINGTSIGAITSLFRHQFKHKGQSVSIYSRPVRFGWEKKEGVDKNGKPTKYYTMTAQAGGHLPPEQKAAFRALRDIYRLRTRGGQAALPEHSEDNSPPPAQDDDPGRLV